MEEIHTSRDKEIGENGKRKGQRRHTSNVKNGWLKYEARRMTDADSFYTLALFFPITLIFSYFLWKN